MKNFELIYEGRVKEVYSVMAETEEEAREKWMDSNPVSSEVIDGEIVKVSEENE